MNATDSAQNLDLNVSGAHLGAGPSKLWQLTGSSVDAANRVGQAPGAEIKEIAVPDVPKTISVAPISVNVYQFPAAQAQ